MGHLPYKFVDFSASTTTTLTELHGVAVRENAGTPAVATVTLRVDTSGGTVVVPIELAADASKAFDISGGIDFGGVVHVEVDAGTVEGSVWGR